MMRQHKKKIMPNILAAVLSISMMFSHFSVFSYAEEFKEEPAQEEETAEVIESQKETPEEEKAEEAEVIPEEEEVTDDDNEILPDEEGSTDSEELPSEEKEEEIPEEEVQEEAAEELPEEEETESEEILEESEEESELESAGSVSEIEQNDLQEEEQSGEETKGTTVVVNYVDDDGYEKTPRECTVIDGTNKILDEGWYVVQGNVSFSEGMIVAGTGEVHLILADGCTLNANDGIWVQ